MYRGDERRAMDLVWEVWMPLGHPREEVSLAKHAALKRGKAGDSELHLHPDLPAFPGTPTIFVLFVVAL